MPEYKLMYAKDADGVCGNCGRPAPPCRCGEVVYLRCSYHPSEQLMILAVPSYELRTLTGQREIARWTDLLECPVKGCDYVRALKRGQGHADRRRNRKTGQQRG